MKLRVYFLILMLITRVSGKRMRGFTTFNWRVLLIKFRSSKPNIARPNVKYPIILAF